MRTEEKSEREEKRRDETSCELRQDPRQNFRLNASAAPVPVLVGSTSIPTIFSVLSNDSPSLNDSCRDISNLINILLLQKLTIFHPASISEIMIFDPSEFFSPIRIIASFDMFLI